MWNTLNEYNTVDDEPRDRRYPGADDPEAAFYGNGMGAPEPERWVDADGVPNPSEGTLSPFATRYRLLTPRRQRHSLMSWFLIAFAITLALLLALPFLKVVLPALTIALFVVAVVIGLGVLALFATLFVGAFIIARRMRELSRSMYM